MLIRYKEQQTTLNGIYKIRIEDLIVPESQKVLFRERHGPFASLPTNRYLIIFVYFIEYRKEDWIFDTKEERDKGYNIIMNNYFTNIEELANDN